MAIRVVVRISVPPANRVAFLAAADSILDAVRKNEAGAQVFEYYAASPDGRSYLIHEVYKDADAFIAHGLNMKTIKSNIGDLCCLDWAYVTGDLPEAVSAQIKAAGGPMVHYGHKALTL